MTTQPTTLTPSAGTGPRSRLRTGLILLCILTLALALRSIFFVGPVASDDMRYMRAAQSIAAGEMNTRLDPGYGRAAFILWLAVWVKLGAGAVALAYSDVVLSLGIVLTVYWLACKWADRATALLTMLWLACLPLDLLTSGLVAPDRLALLCSLLAVGCAYDALRAPPREGRLKLLLACICTALAVSAKETSFVLPIIFGVWALWRVRPLKTALARAVLIGAGSVAVFSLEFAFFHLWTGDWAYRFHAASSLYGDPATAMPLSLREFVYYIAHFLVSPKVLGLCGWLMIVAVLRTFGKLREPHLILVWSLCFFLFMQYGSSSLSHYHPVPKQWRYMLPMVILLLIPVGRWTIDLYRSSVVGRTGTVFLTAGIFVSGIILANERAAERMYSEDSIRCLAIAQQMQQRGELHDIALPNWVARGTALDLQAGIAGWETIDLSDGLQREEAKLLAARNVVLLVPNVMWHHKRNDIAYITARDNLMRHAQTTNTILDWRSPLDRLFARLGPLRRLARQVAIGECYHIDETALNTWTR
ncbi:MAG: glycosyltransferase family 39 protein [Planctomycetes bacterium]|nr:glycosyltransferase family 39 protein [Planctomycetota bacterium]